MNFYRAIFLLFLLLFGCGPIQPQQEGHSLSSSEKEVSYAPLVNSLGDTILTGVEIPVVGEKMSVDEIMDVRVVSVGKPVVTLAHTNIYKAVENPKTIEPFLDTLPKFTVVDPLPLINSIGDTIPTGVPIPARGKKVAVQWPDLVSALPPRYKDNATMDIKFLGVEHGLNSNWVESMIQDSKGFFWFGTYGGGVSRYDGVSFSHFTIANGLTNNIVYEIYEDRKGRIWFGTNGGLMYFDGEEFVHFNEEDGYANNMVFCVMEDRLGNIWFGSSKYGLCKYDGESFTYFFEKEGCQTADITNILEDRNGNIWFSTLSNGLFKFDGSAFTQLLPKEKIGAIHEDEHGNLWIGTLEKIKRYDGQQLNQFSYGGAIYTTEFYEDTQGIIWIGSRLNGLSKYDGQNFTNITEEQGLSSKMITTILEDESGKIWMATYGGINIYNPNSFQHPKEFSNILIRSIFQDSKGNLWFGSDGNGVIKYDGQHYEQFTEDQGFFKRTSAIWAIEEDYQGNIWFGALPGGLIKYDGQIKINDLRQNKQATFTHYFPKDASNSDFNLVISLIEDKHKRLWIGFDGGGLLRFDGKTFYQFTSPEGLIGDKLLPSIVEDHRGNLWLSSTAGGITKVDPGLKSSDPSTFTHYSEREGFSNNAFGSVLSDKLGNILLADSYGNVFSYQEKSGTSDSKMFSRLNQDGVRSKKPIHSMVPDPKGGIWLSGQMGLDFLVLHSKDSSEIKFSNSSYGSQDGLKALNFYSSVLLDDKDRIWWSTGKGITLLDINQYQESDQALEIHLNEIELNGHHIDYRNINDTLAKGVEFDSVYRFSNVPSNLQLPYNINNLTFHFFALDWSAPHHLRYSYLMEGFNEDWSIPDRAAQANFPKLPYGDYSFKVRALGKNNQWSETLSYSFSIYPPVWLTWWAKGIYLLLGLLFVVGIIRLRTRNLKLKSKIFENIIKEKTVAEKALTKSENKFKGVFNSMADVFTRSDMDGKCVMISPSIHQLLGYKPEELLGRELADFYVNPKQRDEIVTKLQKSKAVENFEIDVLKKDGETITISTNAKMYYNSNGEPLGVEGILRDVTEQKRAKDRFRSVFETSPMAEVIVNETGHINLVNEKAKMIFGYDRNEMIGKQIEMLLPKRYRENHPGHRVGFFAAQNETLLGEGRDLFALDKSGREFPVEIALSPMNIDGERMVLSTIIDITMRKKAEIRVQQYQKRLKDLALELTISEEKVRKQIAVDLHDNVGQLLSSSRMQLSRIIEMEENPELTIRIKNISQALLKTIQATREAIFNLSPPQLNEIGLYAAVEDWMNEQIERKYNIKTSICGEQAIFQLEENTRFLIFRSVKELIMNTVKHARAKRLEVDFTSNNGMLEITVQDNGIGFKYNPELFKLKSNAYGLFSIQERMSDLGGSITIESEFDKGTKAKLMIPLKTN